MKVFIGVGHGGIDLGASANKLVEKKINLTMAITLRAELERHGITVKMSREKDENDSLIDEIKEANAFKPDLAVSIHNNAGGGIGFEAYIQTNIYGYISTIVAENIEEQVKKINQNSRGIKTRLNLDKTDYYGFLREVRSPSVILEAAFLDSKDHEKIDTFEEQKSFGLAYAKGILKALNIGENERLYRVQVGAFKDKDSAEKLAERLESEGYVTFII